MPAYLSKHYDKIAEEGQGEDYKHAEYGIYYVLSFLLVACRLACTADFLFSFVA